MNNLLSSVYTSSSSKINYQEWGWIQATSGQVHGVMHLSIPSHWPQGSTSQASVSQFLLQCGAQTHTQRGFTIVITIINNIKITILKIKFFFFGHRWPYPILYIFCLSPLVIFSKNSFLIWISNLLGGYDYDCQQYFSYMVAVSFDFVMTVISETRRLSSILSNYFYLYYT